ncbi:efflux RND transporter periplasmic adaptor subunit [Marinobacterium sedimentorum]|uniref:efflux RND transporter periplasmic adaptor subunit n=1 Tax=Marinobacterium sedimentorum TaxID=2927804 RepID=UPI0020C5E053|nr:efflux RND transporter periplasmic adaptor subunit [Marinobacterium sedimentorum]MCP8687346.1 efflux RND transporter periplasmic adaptor subunit [Marinobacterium sedimentorum]
MHHLRRVIGWVLVATAVLAWGADDPVPGAPALATLTAQLQTIDRETLLDGSLEAVSRSTVAAETNARVVELPFDVNDYVKKGEIIVRFRDTEQQEQVRSAEANLREAQARLNEARQDYGRISDIYARKLIAKSQMDGATATYASARARASAAQAALNQANERLEHMIVRAPYSGIVEERHIQLGEMATLGTPLMTGLSLEHLRALVEVPQSLIGPLREHQQARVILPDGGQLAATDVRIPPAADPATHSFPVKVTLPEGDHGLFPGTLVKVAFKRGSEEMLLLPPTAVVQRSEVTASYVVRPDNRIEFRQLRIGTARADGQLPVLAGLIAGERVALDPIAAGIALKQQSARDAAVTP